MPHKHSTRTPIAIASKIAGNQESRMASVNGRSLPSRLSCTHLAANVATQLTAVMATVQRMNPRVFVDVALTRFPQERPNRLMRCGHHIPGIVADVARCAKYIIAAL